MSEEVMIPKSYHDKVCENIIRFKDKQFYDAVHLLDDGTLEITVEDYTKVKRVLVEDDNHWGNLFYEDGADRPQGEWVWHEDEDICNCSRCDFEIDAEGCIDPIAYVKIYNFCPNCGCRMKGADDEIVEIPFERSRR